MIIKEKYPEWKALVQIPGIGNFIDLTKSNDLSDVPYDTYMVMSLEAAFLYMKEHKKGFCIEKDRSKHDLILPDEVRDYILDNETTNSNLLD